MTHNEAEALTACACGGTGRIEWTEPPDPPRQSGEMVMQFLGALGTSLCPCRKALPPREGEARWWTSERVYSATVAVPMFNESVEIRVDPEVPVSEDNFRVVRRGNRYYPTLINVETPDSLTLHPDTARELAQRLIAAADAADAIDAQDCDPCGHWAPCDCGKSVVA